MPRYYDLVWMHGGVSVPGGDSLFVLNAPESQVMRGSVYRRCLSVSPWDL